MFQDLCYINATVQQSVDHHAVTRPITPAEIRSSHTARTARTVTPVEIRNLEQQLYDLQSEETCLRYALKKYRPSYLRKSSPPLQSRDTSYALYFSKDNARARENLTIYRFQLISIFEMFTKRKLSTSTIKQMWENQLLPLENQSNDIEKRINNILFEEEMKTLLATRNQMEQRKDLFTSKLIRTVRFDVEHFDSQKKSVPSRTSTNGLSNQSISQHFSAPFGTCVDPSMNGWNSSLVTSSVTSSVFEVGRSSPGSLLLSNLGKLPFEEKLERRGRGKNKVRLPRLHRHDASLHERSPFVV